MPLRWRAAYSASSSDLFRISYRKSRRFSESRRTERNGGRELGRIFPILGAAAFLLFGVGQASAAPLIPTVNVGVGTSNNPQDVATSMQVLAVLTVMSLAPAIFVMTTSFVRIVVVIGFLRNALSTQ
ncbi:MAG: hypothetical protein HXO79_08385, partial [Selenomonas sp.]|nr:hypothetical protein [Selenomonas sp.]